MKFKHVIIDVLIIILILIIGYVEVVIAQSNSNYEYYALFKITGTDFEIDVTFITVTENITYRYVSDGLFYGDVYRLIVYENDMYIDKLYFRVGYYIEIINSDKYSVTVLDENNYAFSMIIVSGISSSTAYIKYNGDVELIDVKGFIVLNDDVKSLGGIAEEFEFYLLVPLIISIGVTVYENRKLIFL